MREKYQILPIGRKMEFGGRRGGLGLARQAEILKLLASEVRIKILRALIKYPGICVYEVAEVGGLSHSAASHQLAKLEAYRLVVCAKKGKQCCSQLAKTPEARLARKIINQL